MSIANLDSAPVSITPTITQAQITPEQTAQVELTVNGQREEPTEVTFGNTIPFSSDQRSSPDGILLLPASRDLERKNRQTWLPASDENIIGPAVIAGETFTDGETVTTEWAVWGDPEHGSRIEPGTYDFENSLTIEAEDRTIHWTLTTTIETGSSDT